MSSIRVISGLFLIVLAEVLYDTYAPPLSTNWSVFYFGCVYASLIIFSIDLFIRESKLFIDRSNKLLHDGSYLEVIKLYFTMQGYSGRILIGIIIFFFTFLLYFDLSLINVPFDLYIESVADRFVNDLLRQTILILITILMLTTWVRRLLKK